MINASSISRTGRERVRRLLDSQPIDRVPVMASMIAAAAHICGVPQHRVHLDSQTNALTLLSVCRDLGFDGAYLSSDNWVIHSALGGTIHFPNDDEPMGTGPVLAEWDRFEELVVPDPCTAGRMPFMLEAVRIAVQENRGELFLEANIDSGPFQLAGILRGAENLMLDVVTEPRRVHRLLEFCVEVVAAYATVMATTGVDAIQFGDSTASLVNRETYHEFVKPYQRCVVEAIRKSGVYPFLHVCGNSNHLSHDLAATGAACVEIDAPADLQATMAAVADRAVVRGNIATMLLRSGTAAQVEQSARECLARAGSGRLILSPGCGVPKGTPVENLRTLVQVARNVTRC